VYAVVKTDGLNAAMEVLVPLVDVKDQSIRIRLAMQEYRNGETVSHSEINWD
jgi:hypothetical protein